MRIILQLIANILFEIVYLPNLTRIVSSSSLYIGSVYSQFFIRIYFSYDSNFCYNRFLQLLFQMASGMATLYIMSLEGKAYSIYFPIATFHQTKISELRDKIRLTIGYGIEFHGLLFRSKRLQSDRTFGSYGITDNDTIKLVEMIVGGDFIPLRFTDITSEDNFKPIEFSHSAPDWRYVDAGLNFEGTCKTRACVANKKAVLVPKGFYESTGGMCMLNYEITQLECPMCENKLDKGNISGVGIYKCKLEVKAKREHQDEIRFEMESTDKFRFAQSLDEDDKIGYEYITLKVQRL